MQLVEVDASRFNRRFRVELDDGAAVEAVHYRGDSLCVSSQVGCAVGCPFCASGARGLARPLTLEELWGQVDQVRRLGHAVVRATVSGVGEPLHNHENVRAFVLRCREHGLRVSLTTSGGPLARLAEWLTVLPHNGLTISVHAGNEATRAALVPKGPPLAPLFELLAATLTALSRKRRKKVALAYLLTDDNESDEDVRAFIARARPLCVDVHLYAYNPVATSRQRALSRARYEQVYQDMRAAGLMVRMSSQARTEANGGCGTLVALRKLDAPPAST